MKTVFGEFSTLWPESSRLALKPMLENIPCYFFPEDKKEMSVVTKPQGCVVIVSTGEIRDLVEIIALGFEHCVQRQRPDFASELLASALMVSKPAAFTNNPIPFFFNGFASSSATSTETNMSVPLKKTTDKIYILDRLTTFLNQNPKLQGIADICVQVADELISNALFSAPVDGRGTHVHQQMQRDLEINLPENKQATFFACFTDYRVIVGCEDRFGSFRKNALINHLESSFLKDKVTARSEQSAGAGLGFRYIIENSANFYLYCDNGQRSLVASGLLLNGLRANLVAQKHFHVSFK